MCQYFLAECHEYGMMRGINHSRILWHFGTYRAGSIILNFMLQKCGANWHINIYNCCHIYCYNRCQLLGDLHRRSDLMRSGWEWWKGSIIMPKAIGCHVAMCFGRRKIVFGRIPRLDDVSYEGTILMEARLVSSETGPGVYMGGLLPFLGKNLCFLMVWPLLIELWQGGEFAIQDFYWLCVNSERRGEVKGTHCTKVGMPYA